MVGAFKEAATALKPSGVRVGALNLQARRLSTPKHLSSIQTPSKGE